MGRKGDDAESRGREQAVPSEHIDLLVGGFPCQGASVAGKRRGLADDRTALFWEIIRVQKIINAPWALLENVPGLRSVTLGRDFETVLAALKECWPVVGWRTLDSRFFNIAQRRARVFFVCGPDEARVAQVLFEPEGGAGHPAAGRAAGARVAASLTAGAHRAGVNDPGRRAEDDVNLVVETVPDILARYGKGTDSDATDPMIVVGALGGPAGADDNDAQGNRLVVSPEAFPEVAHALSAEGADASEDGTGRGTPLVIQDVRGVRDKAQHGLGLAKDGTMYTLDSVSQHAVAFTERTRTDGQNVEAQEELAYSLNNPGAGGRTQENRITQGMTVRRLTPTECARLQGFPDGWCCLCQPLEAWAADPEAAAERCACPDSPQYRAYGNAVTVNVVEWLGRRLLTAMSEP